MATRATPPLDQFTSLVATPSTFLEWAEKGDELLQGLVSQTNRPLEQRTLRDFRRSEAMEISGMTEHRWLKFRGNLEEGTQARISLKSLHEMMREAGLMPSRPAGTKPCRVAVANFKGGATKTTVALNLSHYLAFRGWRTLVVDLDPQGTLSRLIGVNPEQVPKELTMAKVFDDLAIGESKPPVIRPFETHISCLDIIPASLQMAGAELSVAAAYMRQLPEAREFYKLIDNALSLVEDDYDIIILDTAPSFGFTALNTMWAATSLLIPMQTTLPDFAATVDFVSMVGDITDRIAVISGVRKEWNPTMFVHSRAMTGATPQLIRDMSSQTFGAHRIDESIPDSKAFQNAVARFRSVYEVNTTDVEGKQLRRARDASDALGERFVTELKRVWAQQSAAAAAPSPVAESARAA